MKMKKYLVVFRSGADGSELRTEEFDATNFREVSEGFFTFTDWDGETGAEQLLRNYSIVDLEFIYCDGQCAWGCGDEDS